MLASICWAVAYFFTPMMRAAHAARGFRPWINDFDFLGTLHANTRTRTNFLCVHFAPPTPSPLTHATTTLTRPGPTPLARYRRRRIDFIGLGLLG